MKVLVVVALLCCALVAAEDKPKPAKRLGTKDLKMVFPKVDTKLIRSSPNVVIVPKGDPRAYGPGRLMFQKAPKPAHPNHGQPSIPVTPPTNPGVQVGAALKSGSPQYSSAQCTAQKGQCIAESSCHTGNVISGICPGPAGIKCCAPKPNTSCLSNFNGATLAARALQYQQSYRAHGVVYSQPNRQFGPSPPVRYADCSAFVTSILDSLQWDCLFQNGRYTGAMIPIMRQRGGFHPTPKLGDIVMWTDHTGIVAGNCPSGQVRMVAMGNSGARDTSCISLNSLPAWGSGSFLGFWTPH